MCSALADVRFGSFASGSGRPPLQPCPLCPESDRRPKADSCTATKSILFDQLADAFAFALATSVVVT
jgi:hypothetical protein